MIQQLVSSTKTHKHGTNCLRLYRFLLVSEEIGGVPEKTA